MTWAIPSGSTSIPLSVTSVSAVSGPPVRRRMCCADPGSPAAGRLAISTFPRSMNKRAISNWALRKFVQSLQRLVKLFLLLFRRGCHTVRVDRVLTRGHRLSLRSNDGEFNVSSLGAQRTSTDDQRGMLTVKSIPYIPSNRQSRPLPTSATALPPAMGSIKQTPPNACKERPPLR